jgi:Ni,Fe-hydrogenase III small subunit
MAQALKKSAWVFPFFSGSCNNCNIEILDCLTPKFDLERFGVLLVGNARHADAILVAGVLNKKGVPRLKRIYQQVPKPCLVIAVGACALSQGIFSGSYAISELPVDRVVPVDIYIPGCPPKPEAIIAGLIKALGNIGTKVPRTVRKD